MAVRPIEFQGMINNTQELSGSRANEQQRPAVMQDQVSQTVQQQAALSTTQVSQSEESSADTYDSSKEGNGGAFGGSQGKKEKEKKKKVMAEGSVKKKNGYTAFEISI